MKKAKKLLAMLLCIVMCLSLFPVSVFAEGEGEAPRQSASGVYTSSTPSGHLPLEGKAYIIRGKA